MHFQKIGPGTFKSFKFVSCFFQLAGSGMQSADLKTCLRRCRAKPQSFHQMGSGLVIVAIDPENSSEIQIGGEIIWVTFEGALECRFRTGMIVGVQQGAAVERPRCW